VPRDRSRADCAPLSLFGARPRRVAVAFALYLCSEIRTANSGRWASGGHSRWVRSERPPRPSQRASAGQIRLTMVPRQSKLSPQQLEELQKSTHFDKKELQQWYKGTSDKECASIPARKTARKQLRLNIFPPRRLPERLPLRHAHERRIPKDIPTVLPLWRS
jgi:hypothetical protein